MKDITETLLQSKACKPSIHPLGTSTAAAPPAHFDFTRSLLTADNLAVMPLPQRRRLLGAWLCEGDLGYLFAPRGHGKSWMAMLIANAVATGTALGSWQKGEQARPVFYFDAEMNLPDVQDRAQKIGITSENFHWLSNEHLYMDQAISVNIASTEHQSALSAMLPDGALFIIDNLSTSQSGMKENDNDDFDKIKDWLLSLRRRSITVLIVHHAGRSGEMRGSSRREDPAHWILSLRDASEDGAKAKQFITTFTKCRNCQGRDAMPLRWTLQDEADRITVFCESFSGSDALLAHIRDGIVSATDLAQTLNVQTSTISKWAKKLMQAGLIRKNGRDYEPVDWPI
jgi:putative DNA primase/helicase